jgi:hypothetical protein
MRRRTPRRRTPRRRTPRRRTPRMRTPRRRTPRRRTPRMRIPRMRIPRRRRSQKKGKMEGDFFGQLEDLESAQGPRGGDMEPFYDTLLDPVTAPVVVVAKRHGAGGPRRSICQGCGAGFWGNAKTCQVCKTNVRLSSVEHDTYPIIPPVDTFSSLSGRVQKKQSSGVTRPRPRKITAAPKIAAPKPVLPTCKATLADGHTPCIRPGRYGGFCGPHRKNK